MHLSFRKTLLSLGLFGAFTFTLTAETFYTSVKSQGMAGAVSAHPLDALVAAYNPGGLGFVGNRWDLGIHVAQEWGKTQYKDNPFVDGDFNSHHGWNWVIMPEFGVNKYTCNDIFTWGFAIYDRSFYKTNYQYANPIYGTSKLGLEYIHAVAAFTGSVIIAEDHCIGVSLDLHGQRLKVNGLENFATDEFSSYPTKVTNKGYDYSGGFGGTIGWMSRVSDNVSIGAAYSPEIRMSRLKSYRGLVAHGGRIFIPQRVVGAVAIEMLCGLTLAIDIEHINYNFIKALSNRIAELDENLLGERDGAGLGWMDQTIFRLGLDWDINEEFSARCGYVYHRDPVRSSQTYANALIPFIADQILTWGGSWKWQCNEISFYGAYIFKKTKKGSSSSIPDDFGGGSVNLREEKWAAGLSWGRFF